MACVLTTGRSEPCLDAVGGLQTVYFFDRIADAFTIVAGEATAMNVSLTSAFQYDLKNDGNSYEEVGTADSNNGTFTVAQTLTFSLKKQDAATANEIALLAKAQPGCVVKDRMGNYKVAGLVDGVLISGTGASGGEKASFNGYNLTGTGDEVAYAPTLDSTTVTAFLAVVSATQIAP